MILGLEEIDREIAHQRSGKVDMAYAAEMGRQKGAEFVLYGRMSELHKEFRLTSARLGDSVGLAGAAALVWDQLEAAE